MKNLYTDEEVARIGQLCRDGVPFQTIVCLLGRTEASVRSVIRRNNWSTKRATYKKQQRREPAKVAARRRRTQAPAKLPAEARSTYPVNFAGHARWLRW